MGRMRKGVLLTISILVIASSFLFLLTHISLYSNSMKDATASLSNFEKINMQFDSASYGIKQILLTESMNISAEGTNISFSKNLSIATNYKYDLSNFRQFIEAYSSVNTTIDISEALSPKLYIGPQNIVIDHQNGKINFTPENTVQSAGNIEGYDVLITLNVPTLWINWSQSSELPESNPDSMYFHLGMQGSNGTMYMEKYIDKYNPTEFGLVNSQNVTLITISANSPASLSINYTIDMYLKTIVRLNNSASVELGRDIVNVTVDSEAEKLGKVIVFES